MTRKDYQSLAKAVRQIRARMQSDPLDASQQQGPARD